MTSLFVCEEDVYAVIFPVGDSDGAFLHLGRNDAFVLLEERSGAFRKILSPRFGIAWLMQSEIDQHTWRLA